MFFQLTVWGIERGDLGWILSKHPENNFSRDVKKGRHVEAGWFPLLPSTLPSSDAHQRGEGETETPKEAVVYSYKGRNDPLQFLDMMRFHNRANYVHAQLSAVCPFNLLGFREVFKSTLAMKYGDQSKKHNDMFPIEGILGPWPFSLERVLFRYQDVGIEATPHPFLERTVLLKASSIKVDEFMQKVYCIAYVLTDRVSAIGKDEPKVSLAPYMSDWIDSIKDKRLKTRLAEERNPIKLKEREEAERKKANEEKKKAQHKGKGKGKEKEKEGDDEVIDDEEEEEAEVGLEDAVEGELPKEAMVTLDTDTAAEPAPPAPPAKVDSDDVIIGTGKKMRLHERRHEFILGWLAEVYPTKKDAVKILDYGCARGHLTVEIAQLMTEAHLIAMDANPWVGKTRKMKAIRRIHAVCCNLLFPPNLAQLQQIDVVVFCEVIEHFAEAQRAQLMNIILYVIRPKHLVITSPNVAYNPLIPNMKTRFRHPDHQIEYTREEWTREVLNPLQAAGYKITEHKLLAEEEGAEQERIQPSFLVTADLPINDPSGIVTPVKGKSNIEKIGGQLVAELAGMQDPLWLPRNQTLMDSKKLNAGYSSMQYIQYSNDFFAGAPTIAPVDYKEDLMGDDKFFLEHPEAAFEYFASFGIAKVSAEKKYMGSRAQVLAFRTEKCPKGQSPIQIRTRNGAKFFDDEETAQMFHKELEASMAAANYDWVILDGEMLPWIAKGEKLIETEFKTPGECALVSRRVASGEDSQDYKRAAEFLKSLDWHIQRSPLEYRIFQILAAGRITKLGAMEHLFLGEYLETQKRYDAIKQLESEHVKCVEYRFVDISSKEDRIAATKEWSQYCDNGGEGWVVKAYPVLHQFDTQGRVLLPMVKVRGREYLRIVYGIDYLEPKYFKEVTKRKIGPKRAVSRKQFELADTILKCFIHGHQRQKLKAVAAFFGANEKDVNATL